VPIDGRQADVRTAGDERHPPDGARLWPPPEGRRWWNARREERAILLLKVVAGLLAVGMVVGGVWVVRTMMDVPGQQLAETCAGGPWAIGSITDAGGPESAADDPDALTPYTAYPALTVMWLVELRGAATGAGDEDLARAAFMAYRGGLVADLDHLHTVERRCADHRDDHRVPPNPRDIFVNARSN